MNKLVSVVVPTYKRPALLKRCLLALSRQTLQPDEYEVLVVDDGDDEATRRLVENFYLAGEEPVRSIAELNARSENVVSFGCGPLLLSRVSLASQATNTTWVTISYLTNPGKRGPAAARNAGWRAAQGEIIAFTDDDCMPTPDWLENGLKAFAPGVSGVSGRVRVPICQPPTDYERDATGLERSRFVTANCFYRARALEEIGGFDEQFSIAWREDSDLYFRMLKRGWRLVDAPGAQVIHPVRPAQWGVSLRQQGKSRFNALLFKKHPELYRTLQASPPWNYYAALGALFFGTGALLLRWPAAAWPAFAAWAGFTLEFALRRLRGSSRKPGHVLEMLVTSLLIPFLSVYWRLYGAIKYRVFFL